jgi:DNA primase
VSIPQSFLQELLARVDVVDVVGRYVPLKKGGANFMGLCPFHGEKSPSFSVSPSKQFYHCFGCGKNGNAISFLMEHTGMGFVEAVQDLAQQVGMQVPQDDISPAERERQAAQKRQQASLTDVLERAGDSYRKQLKDSAHAVEYLKKRGVSGAICSRYGLGYAPAGWRHLAGVFPQYDDPQLQEAGLVIVNEDDDKRYDRFRDRIMFPIRNVKGECIGFGGRVLGDEKPKYLNSPETPLFHKGRELYGLFEARNALREKGYALVTEGYMDVVALAQLGFPNAVATLGTACTPEHVHKLFRFTDAVVFSFDGDAAGRRAARKALEGALPYASDTRSVKFLFLPAEHDPDSFIREHGPDAFARHVGDALPLSRFLLDAVSEGCDLGQAEGRARMASQARPLWNLLPDGALKRQLLAEMAGKAQLSSSDLTELWEQAAAQENRWQRGGAGGANPTPATGSQAFPAASVPPSAEWAPPDADYGHSAHDGWGDAGGGGNTYTGYAGGARGQGGNGYGNRGNFRNGNGPRGEGRNGWGKKPWGRDRAGNTGWNEAPRPPRIAQPLGPDQAARLLLSHMEFMEELANEDLDALVSQPAPHGPLFAWVESQYQEHGPQSWAVLQSRLGSSGEAQLARTLMDGPHGQPEGELPELRCELRSVLNLMLVKRLKTLEAQALAEVATDPQAVHRYRALQERRKQLAAAPAPQVGE